MASAGEAASAAANASEVANADEVADAEVARNKLVFLPSGRLGNALFRYLACAVVNSINPTLEYTLLSDFQAPDYAFTYYHGLDYEGGDAYRAEDRTVNTMQKEALRNPLILGFNTLGYHKNEITFDKLIANAFINKENGQGIYIKNTLRLNDENFFQLFYKNFENFNVKMTGFFQFDYLYLKYKPQILQYIAAHQSTHWIEPDLGEKYLMQDLMLNRVLLAEKIYDIVIHLRLGDFNGRPDFIEIEHYLRLFATLLPVFQAGKRICLLCQDTFKHASASGDKAYIASCLQWFQDQNLIVQLESNDLMTDFNIMKQARVLVCSMSTLAWMAAYLSTQIETCYMPNYNFYGTDRQAAYFHHPIANTILYPVKTTPTIIGQMQAYIITLPEYSHRLAKLDSLIQQLAYIGLMPHISQGVHGKDIKIYDAVYHITGMKHLTWQDTSYLYDTRVRLNGKPMSKGEMGCAWSHLNLLRQLASGAGTSGAGTASGAGASGTQYYLIFEDDVELIKPIGELYELLQNVPADADLCHLAKSDWHPFNKTNQVNPYFYECEKKYFNRTTAYLISQKGAEKVLEYTKNSINVPSDDLFNMVFRETPDFRFYVPETPYFMEQANILSSIATIDNS